MVVGPFGKSDVWKDTDTFLSPLLCRRCFHCRGLLVSGDVCNYHACPHAGYLGGASRALQHPAILAIPVRNGLVSVVLLAVELCDAPDIPNNSLERMCLYIGNNVGGSRAGWGGVAVCFACVLCTYTWHCCVVRQVSVDVSFQQAVRKEELLLLKFAKLKITIA